MAGNKFTSFLESAGKAFLKGLGFVLKYAVPVETLVGLIFGPLAGTAATSAFNALDLIQKAVISVEQKYAASGVQNGTGAQKSAEVLTLVESAVIDLLAKENIHLDTDRVQKIINAVVALLNLKDGAVVTA